jgi:hypothetical protein
MSLEGLGWMDGTLYYLLNCVHPWIIKINTTNMIAFQRGGAEQGATNQKYPEHQIMPQRSHLAYPWFCFHGSKDCLGYSKAI